LCGLEAWSLRKGHKYNYMKTKYYGKYFYPIRMKEISKIKELYLRRNIHKKSREHCVKMAS
jgi:hypothetical protein